MSVISDNMAAAGVARLLCEYALLLNHLNLLGMLPSAGVLMPILTAAG